MGGAEGKVAYIGESTLKLHPARTHFLPQIRKARSDQRGESPHFYIAGPADTTRIAQIAERFGSKIARSKIMNSSWALTFVVDPEQAQENISYGRALNSEARLSSHPMAWKLLTIQKHQLELLNTLSAQFSGNEYRLLIIDSIMACFRVDYCGRGELADRQQKLNQFLSKLTHMAEEFNVCVLMVRCFSLSHSTLLCILQRKALPNTCSFVSNDADGLSIFARRTRFRATPGLMLSSPELTVVNLLEVISLPTPRPHVFFWERDEVTNA